MKGFFQRLFGGKCTPENTSVSDPKGADKGKEWATSATSAETQFVSTPTAKVSAEQVSDAMNVLIAPRHRMKILLDNGHGRETQGKRSPDGCLREWEYARDIALSVEIRLRKLGYDVCRIVPEQEDVKLSERVRRVNKWCKQYGATNVLVVSIHVNAASSDGKWHDASGWQACVSHNASVRSMKLAECLADAAIAKGVKVRKPSPTQKWWSQNLAICRDTNCPAVLTENMFMDNKKDVDWLLSEEGRQTIAEIHVKGIADYVRG